MKENTFTFLDEATINIWNKKHSLFEMCFYLQCCDNNKLIYFMNNFGCQGVGFSQVEQLAWELLYVSKFGFCMWYIGILNIPVNIFSLKTIKLSVMIFTIICCVSQIWF